MTKPEMLDADKTVFVLIDVQGKLAQIVHDRETLFDNVVRLVKGMRILRIPILWLEQVPSKMGQTVPEVRRYLGEMEPIVKASFSACGSPLFREKLEELGRRQALLAGIETHVCVWQTAVDLLGLGYQVQVVADAVSSRTALNKDVGLEKIRSCGGLVTSTEMVLMELLRTAEHPCFRDILEIVR
ncbi:MAG: hydrolase [Kiritimatiellae bacterium]|nr:hydrolase [Kiritimatiellia bacterium]